MGHLRKGITSLLLIFSPFICIAQGDLQTPLNYEDIFLEGLEPEAAAYIIAPAEDWRVRGVALLAIADASSDPLEDLRLVADGVRLQVGERNLVDEFLGSLSDDRLTSVFQRREDDQKPRDLNGARARAALADEILSRPSLSAFHAEAGFLKGQMSFLFQKDIDQAKTVFGQASEFTGDESFAEKSAAALAALTDPVSPEAFEQTIELMELAISYQSRNALNNVSGVASRSFKVRGPQVLNPNLNDGSAIPLIATTRVAFDRGKKPLLIQIEEEYDSWNQEDVGIEERAQVDYWLAMYPYSQSQYDDAQERFQAVVNSDAVGEYAALSSMRLALCYHHKRQYLDAIIQFLDTAELYPQHLAIASQSEKEAELLINGGFVDELILQASLSKRNSDRDVAAKSVKKGGSE